MKKFFVFLAMMFTAGVYTAMAQGCATPAQSTATVTFLEAPETLLWGEFSISATKKVRFSKGNLQFNAMAGSHTAIDGANKQGKWQFAENQYDMITGKNANISSSYNGWIDLLGWGTSGWNNTSVDPLYENYEPWSYANTLDEENLSNPYHYGPSVEYLPTSTTWFDAELPYCDWGIYNFWQGADAGYRTLSIDEWKYLIERNSGNLCGLARVEYTTGKYRNGLVLLPDGWTSAPTGASFTVTTANYTTNTYTPATWALMEAAGAVFLPAAGRRYNGNGDTSGMGGHGNIGFYYSSTANNQANCPVLYFGAGFLNTTSTSLPRSYGAAVRLVQEL